MQLEGKVAVITGAASGMGRAMALGYAREGARVVIADMNEAGAAAVAAEIAAAGGPKALAIGYDVRDPEKSKALVARVLSECSALDVLVNNAGVGLAREVWRHTPADWDRIFDVNVKGLFFLSQAAAEPMRERKRGKIINLASIAGRKGRPMVIAYAASKAAVISITQSMALALAPYRVNVNAMAPGIVDTPFWKQTDAEFAAMLGKPLGQHFKDVSASIPLGRPEQPEDVVPLAVFLAGAGSDYITGQTFNVEGGIELN
jgi:NAD(P)-dependent dehydrogenase (short-subunit alcohol dehydrogenase family)